MNQAKQIQLNPPSPAHQAAEEIISTVKGLLVERPVGTKEVAEYLGICRDSVYRQIDTGAIPAKLVHKFNNRHYFFLSEIREYLKSI